MHMKHLSLIAAAVAASCVAGQALAIAPGGPFAVTLTISGASAFQGAIESELSRVGSAICNNPTAGTATYNRFLSSANDFRAYTCNLAPGVLSPGGGEAAAIYYRGEGGSVVGLAPLLSGTRFNGAAIPTPKRLALSGCPAGAPAAGATVTCTIGAYSLASEAAGTAVTGLENATSQVGFADVEPSLFFGENYPTASATTGIPFLQPALSAGERNTLNGNAEVLVGQSFALVVNTSNAELAALPSLSKTTVSSILRGEYADWSSVPNGSGGTVTTTSLPIKLCRREQGSGTQVAASIFFNSYPTTLTPFASGDVQGALAVDLGGGGVVENASTGAMRTCISTPTAASGGGAAGGIGYYSTEADAAGRHAIQIDNQGTSIAETANNTGVAVATGQYDFWYEEVVIKSATLGGAALTLANKLIPVTRTQATGPTSPNITFLSPFNAAVYPPAVVAGRQPVSCLRRNKVSTVPAANQC
jgi:hypothetical protein